MYFQEALRMKSLLHYKDLEFSLCQMKFNRQKNFWKKKNNKRCNKRKKKEWKKKN